MPGLRYLMNRRHLPGILYSILAWISAVSLFGFVRLFGTHERGISRLVEGATWRTDVLGMAIASVVIGVSSGIINILLDTRRVRKLPFGITILVKSLCFGSIFTATFFTNVFTVGFLLPGAAGMLDRVSHGEGRETIIVTFVYAAVVNLMMDFIRQVDRKLGPRQLGRFITGRYHKPREEERIFMFLDLTSSTSHAERLGHIRYSRLIQDCFFDLTDVVTRYNAEVYQYVGDEVVLTWKVNGRNTHRHIFDAQFAFHDILRDKEEYYRANYGFVPVFKTGAHVGRVTVAEVGEIKREIAFHGDVLNTAARITSKCNEVGEPFLVSETLMSAAGKSHPYRFDRIGEVPLRGKQHAVNLFAVNRTPPSVSPA